MTNDSQPENKWFIRIGEKVRGPFTSEKIRALVENGKIDEDTEIRRDPEPIWRRAGQMRGLFPDDEVSERYQKKPRRRSKKKKAYPITYGDTSTVRNEVPGDTEWTSVSEIAKLGSTAALYGVGLWFLAFLAVLATGSFGARIFQGICSIALLIVFLVEIVCLVIMLFSKKSNAGKRYVAIGSVTSVTPLVLVIIFLSIAQPVAQRQQRFVDMRNVAMAVLSFDSTYGHLPAPASYNKEGKPLLSWRVHILPFLEEKPLYDRFHLDEPWDSEHNRTLIEKIPKVYQGFDSPEGKTNFLLVVGERSVFAGPAKEIKDRERGMGLHLLRTAPQNSVGIVEVPPEQSVTWTQPSDWEYEEQGVIRQLTSFRSEGNLVGNINPGDNYQGMARFLSLDMDDKEWELLLPLITDDQNKNGRNNVPADPPNAAGDPKARRNPVEANEEDGQLRDANAAPIRHLPGVIPPPPGTIEELEAVTHESLLERMKTMSRRENSSMLEFVRGSAKAYFKTGVAGRVFNVSKTVYVDDTADLVVTTSGRSTNVSGIGSVTTKQQLIFSWGAKNLIGEFSPKGRHGEWAKLTDDGRLSVRGRYESGRRRGTFTVYDDLGRRRWRGYYDENEVLTSAEEYENGRSTTSSDVATLDGHAGEVRHLFFSEDESFLVSIGNQTGLDADVWMRIWNTDTWGLSQIIHSPYDDVEKSPMVLDATSTQMSPDNRWIFGRDAEKKMHVWRREDGEHLLSFTTPGILQPIANSDGSVTPFKAIAQTAVYSANGSYLAAIADGQIQVWDLETLDVRSFERPEFVPPHEKNKPPLPEVLTISSDGRQLIGAGRFGLRVWDISTAKISHAIPFTAAPWDVETSSLIGFVCVIATEKEGEFLSVKSHGRGCRIDRWNVNQGSHQIITSTEPIISRSQIEQFSFMENYSQFAYATEEAFAVLDCNGGKTICDTTFFSERANLSPAEKAKLIQEHEERGLSWHPRPPDEYKLKGPIRLIPNAALAQSGGDDKLWSMRTGEPALLILGYQNPQVSPDGDIVIGSDSSSKFRIRFGQVAGTSMLENQHVGRSTATAFSPNKFFAVAGSDSSIHVWDFGDARQRMANAKRAENRIPIVKFTPYDGNIYANQMVELMATADDPDADPVRFEYRVGSNDLWRRDLDGRFNIKVPSTADLTVAVRAIDNHGGISQVVEQTLPIIETEFANWQVLRTFVPSHYNVTKRLLGIKKRQVGRKRRIKSEPVVQEVEPENQYEWITFSSDQTRLIAWGDRQNRVRTWMLNGAAKTNVVYGVDSDLRKNSLVDKSFMWSGNGSELKVFSTSNGKLQSLPLPQRLYTKLEAASLSPDGKQIALFGHADSRVRVYKWPQLEFIHEIDLGNRPVSLRYHPNGKHIVSLNAYSLTIHDVITGEQIASHVLDKYETGIISDDCERVFATNRFEIWCNVLSVETGKIVQRLQVPGQRGTRAPSVFKNYFFGGNDNGIISIVEIDSGVVIASLDTHAPILDFAVSPNGAILAVSLENGTIQLWADPQNEGLLPAAQPTNTQK